MMPINPQLRRRVEELERSEDWPALHRLLRMWPWPERGAAPLDPESAFEDVMRRARVYERRS